MKNGAFKVKSATGGVLGYPIPAKGSNLTIDTANFVLYKNLIAYETGKRISVNNGAVFLGDSIITRYTFEMNYY
jgi:signal peptidase I